MRAAIPLSQLVTSPHWQSNFLSVLPTIQDHARISFRHLRPGDKAEATAETIARAFVDYGRLAQRHRLAHAYPTSLATYAVKGVRRQRRVGGRQNVRDAMDPLAQKVKGFTTATLSPWDRREASWKDLVVEDRRTNPADLASFHLDFQSWLKRWPPRLGRIILAMAAGSSSTSVARQFGVSASRISQLRRRFDSSWAEFQGPAGA